MEQLRNFGIIPFSRGALTSLLQAYSSPNDKISSLIANGDIIPLKKGLYVVSERYRSEKLSMEVLANQIYGPSYVSLDSALSYYGIIPEKVNVVTSVTVKRSRKFENQAGNFTYLSAPKNYVGIGVVSESSDGVHSFLIASPEKALCDKIIFTRNLRLASVKSVAEFLNDDLRADFSETGVFDFSVIERCVEFGIKKRELSLLLKYLIKNY